MNRIKKAKLLILDDFGLQQMSHDVKLTLLQILEDRYKEAATDQNLAITTEKLARLYWRTYCRRRYFGPPDS